MTSKEMRAEAHDCIRHSEWRRVTSASYKLSPLLPQTPTLLLTSSDLHLMLLQRLDCSPDITCELPIFSTSLGSNMCSYIVSVMGLKLIPVAVRES